MNDVKVTDELLRRDLIEHAKVKIGFDHAAASEDVRDAVEACRIAGDHALANNIDYEQWVASL